jgi:hypothetical protein
METISVERRRAWAWGLRLLAAVFVVALALVLGRATPSEALTGRPLEWSQGPSLPGGFVPRWDLSSAYYPPTDAVVLFGGSPKDLAGTFKNDTWLYANGAWSAGPGAPPSLRARGGAAMAYLPEIQKLVLFGGQGSTWPPLNDTWLFNGSSWVPGPAAPTALKGRTGAQLVYDPDLNALVLFGGSGLGAYTDTWLFDGSSWQRGPDAPAEMNPRQFFGMAYDPNLHRVVAAGGTGGTDVWMFDGSSWQGGPSLPTAEPKERFRMDYDPQLGGITFFSGLGPGIAGAELYVLRNGSWDRIIGLSDTQPWPVKRVDGVVAWNPAEDALMVLGGIADDYHLGVNGLKDTWFFREVPPRVDGVSLSPSDPYIDDRIVATKGADLDGYGRLDYEWAWEINGFVAPGVSTSILDPGTVVQGDVVVAKVRATDLAGITGPWVFSPPVTVVNRAPTFNNVVLRPIQPYVTSTLLVSVTLLTEPDGDPVTLHYAWQVDGTDVPDHDVSTLGPTFFTQGDQVQVTVTAVDSLGLAGTIMASDLETVAWNIAAGSGAPGGTVSSVNGYGFGAGENVDVRLDSPTGPLLVTTVADSDGTFRLGVPLPGAVAGGSHMMFGVGRTSGVVGPGPFTVVPTGSLNPKNVAAGDGTTFSGAGFLSGETVSLAFPGGPVVQGIADASGTVTVGLLSPPEPAPGGSVLASGQAGTVGAPYTVLARLTLPATAKPGVGLPVTVTGYGASETVDAFLDTLPTTQKLVTDPNGSAGGQIVLSPRWGEHTILMKGGASGVAKSGSVNFPAWILLTPSSGPVGVQFTATSGPGWIPGQDVQFWFGSKLIRTVKADSVGRVSTTYTVPQRKTGAVTVKFKDPNLPTQAATSFTVTASKSSSAEASGGTS